MEALIVLCFSLLISVPGTIWQGFIMTKLWLWFVVPVFGVSAITIAPAIGLLLIASFMTNQQPIGLDKLTWGQVMSREFTNAFIFPTVIFAIAAIVHAFM